MTGSEGIHRKLSTALNHFAQFVSDFSAIIYVGLISCLLLACLAAAYFLTVEADEAWMLLSTFNAFGAPVPLSDALVSPTLTSGGVHLLLHGFLAWFTSIVIIHRIISFVFTLILTVTVYLLIKRPGRTTSIALGGTALFATVPGFIFQAGLATAEIIATTLLIVACIHWINRGQRYSRSAVLTGILFGLSCATRINCVVAMPVFVVFATFAGGDRWARIYRPLICVATAVIVLIISMAAYVISTANADGTKTAQFFLESSGVSGGKSLSQLMWAFSIANGIMPAWLIGIVAVGCAISLSRRSSDPSRSQETRLTALLVLIGLAGLAAWIAKAPIPHIRYLWPALPCLWLAGVLQVAYLMSRRPTPLRDLPFHLMIFVACVSRLADDLLILANGESLTMVYQANGIASSDFPGPAFRASSDQIATAKFVKMQRSDTQFYTPIPSIAFPITLLSGRGIASIEKMRSSGDRYLVWSPADSHVWHPDAAFVQWIRTNTSPVLTSGDFAIFRVKNGNSEPPPALMLRGGGNSVMPLRQPQKRDGH